ncbi:MAG: VanZ family protein [Verrucomicrobiae bacterium]|nr:VanZ family protein [Verrucomicrobiae bacterium]
MRARPTWFRRWLPVGLWMLVIFIASTGALSADNTSRVIGPVLRFFFPDIQPGTIAQAQWVFRKAAHAAEYWVLALLVWRARRQGRDVPPGHWQWKEAAFALGFATAYAITDEVHQYFEPSRQGQVMDVAIDALGAAAGLGVAWWSTRRAAARQRPASPALPAALSRS